MNGEQVYAPPQAQGNGFGDFDFELKPQQAPNVIEQPKSKKTIVLKIYEDENGKKYIDAPALTSMKGMEPSFQYTRPDGQIVSVSSSLLRDKPADEIPNDFVSSKTVYPDFSSEYPFDPVTGMYEVTDADIAALVELYESMYPDVEVIVEIEKISSKKFNNVDGTDDNLQDKVSELLDRENNKNINHKEDYDVPSELVENNQNKEYQPSNVNNKDTSELSKMLEEENQNKEYPKYTM